MRRQGKQNYIRPKNIFSFFSAKRCIMHLRLIFSAHYKCRSVERNCRSCPLLCHKACCFDAFTLNSEHVSFWYTSSRFRFFFLTFLSGLCPTDVDIILYKTSKLFRTCIIRPSGGRYAESSSRNVHCFS